MRFAPLVMAAALVVLGCATATQQARRTETAGFLGSYSQLQKGGEAEALLVYRNPDADFTRYDKVLVEPVAAWGSASTEVDMDRLQVLIDYLDAALRHALARSASLLPGIAK